MTDLHQLAEGVRIVMSSGIEYFPDTFVELTEAMYESLRRQGEHPDIKYYRIVPMEPKMLKDNQLELSIVTESQRQYLLDAVQLVYRMSNESGKTFESFSDRIEYLRPRLPSSIAGFDSLQTDA